MASIRFQSVLDRRFVFFPFFMICLPQRNDSDSILRAFRERDKCHATLNHPNAYPSLLAIVLTRVGMNEESAAEHFFRIGEMKPMFLDILPILPFIPFEVAFRGVYKTFLVHDANSP
jgi:hypothetical protein